MPGEHPLPIVVYLDNITMYGYTQEWVLEDMLEAINQLAMAGFMLNLHKSQLVQVAAKVLGHLWTSSSNFAKLATLLEKSDSELSWFN